MRALPLLLFAMFAAFEAGCASDDATSNADANANESDVTAGDREIARIGGGGSFAVADDGAYLVFDRALYRVGSDGTRTRLADAPDKADRLVVSGRYVVLEASPLSGDVITFYDRQNGFAAKQVSPGDRTVELLPASNDRVVVSFLDSGVFVMDASGAKELVFEPPRLVQARDLRRGANDDLVLATVDRLGGEGLELVEIDLKTKKKRVVLDVDKGSFHYAFDPATKTFFTVRSHVTFPTQSILVVYDDHGNEKKRLETPMNTFGAMEVDADHFYLAARPGPSPGVGSWKLFAFDKATLEMSDRGRVEPQVFDMVLRGKDLFYAHSKDSATPLRLRTL